MNRITKIGYENPHCDLIHENGKFANFVRPCDEDTYRKGERIMEECFHCKQSIRCYRPNEYYYRCKTTNGEEVINKENCSGIDLINPDYNPLKENNNKSRS